MTVLHAISADFKSYGPHFFYQREWDHDEKGGRKSGEGGGGGPKRRWRGQGAGEEGPGRATSRERRRPGLLTLSENLPEKETKDQTMPRFGGDLREGEEGTQRCRGNCAKQNPAGQGRQRRGRTGAGTAADTGTRSGAQGQAAESGGWRLMTTPRWAAFCTRRRGEEQFKQEGFDEERLWMWRR